MNLNNVLPVELESFLMQVLGGKVRHPTLKLSRLVSSIGQDICRAVTNAEWKLPKHVSLSMTLCHMFRSKELITLINRFGHSESHSFSLELETAIATSLQESSSILTNNIIRNPSSISVFHSEFDNFDQYVNELHGSGSIHTAHGIMLQEISDDTPSPVSTLPADPRQKQWSWKQPVFPEFEEVYLTQRQSPMIEIKRLEVPGSRVSSEKAQIRDVTWILLRNFNAVEQHISGWAGFVSQTGVKPIKKTTIEYYPVVYKPITQYSTVQECLLCAEKATNEVGQCYVFTTFDLGVCMKAYPLVWKFPERYERHIVLIGTFHLTMAYYKMIGKKMEGSGFSDVLLEAGLISSGSLQGVVSGKNFSRATHCHKLMYETLHRLLLQEFMRTQDEESNDNIQKIFKGPSTNIDEILSCHEVIRIVNLYMEFCQSVRNGSLGKTAQFWLSYMDHVSLVLALTRSVKANEFDLYAYSLQAMCDLFFSFG